MLDTGYTYGGTTLSHVAAEWRGAQVPGILLDWSYTPRQIRRHAADIIRRWRALDDAIANTPAASATFENTFGAVTVQ